MNIDEAIKITEQWDQNPTIGESLLDGEIVAIVLAAEVKRLREFSEAQRQDNEQLRDRIKVMQSELEEAGDGDTWRNAWRRVELELEKTRAELDAVKAFYAVAVKERDYERVTVEALKKDLIMCLSHLPKES